MSEVEKNIHWCAQSLEAPAPWHGLLLPLPSLPLDKSLRRELYEKLNHLLSLLKGARPLCMATWLLMDTLHQDGESKKIAAHGRQWMPDPGLGVWPDREPPHAWTDDEFLEREYGTPLRPLMHTVMHISAGEAASMHAWETMAGTGSVIQLLIEKSPEEFHAAAKAHLLPTIEDESFRGFSMYFPLLCTTSIRGKEADELDRWLGPAVAYVRESAEDSGIFLLSRIDPADALRESGIVCEPLETAGQEEPSSGETESGSG